MASQRVCGISKIEKNRYRSRCCLRVTKTTSDTSVDSERRLGGRGTLSTAVAVLQRFWLCLLLSWGRSTARRGIGSAAFPARPS